MVSVESGIVVSGVDGTLAIVLGSFGILITSFSRLNVLINLFMGFIYCLDIWFLGLLIVNGIIMKGIESFFSVGMIDITNVIHQVFKMMAKGNKNTRRINN